MASIPGTILAAKISPGDTAATFPTHEDIYGKGGLVSVTNFQELTSIPLDRQKVGMLINVNSDSQYYTLNSLSYPLTSYSNLFSTTNLTISSLSSQFVKINTNTYVIAQAGDNLIAKYNEAKVLTPNGQALSNINRATLIILLGRYTSASPLEVNTEFVDIIGLGSQKLHRGAIAAVLLDGNVIPIVVTANNVRIKGLGTTSNAARIQIGSNLPLQVFEDCVAGDNSFGSFDFGGASSAGTFINCKGGAGSFGFQGEANGTFINCEAGDLSFATAYEDAARNASGIFKNCKAGDASFGYGAGSEANGTFENCEAENFGFGGNGRASGTFINCVGAIGCFGGVGALTGEGSTSGTFTNCTGGNQSFGTNNFGAFRAGKLYNCRLIEGTFLPVTAGGLMRNCIDGNNNIVDQ